MGVSKLTKYFNDHPKARHTVSLQSLAQRYKQLTGKNAKLLCDYYSIIQPLLSSQADLTLAPTHQLESCCGNFKKFSGKIIRFVETFQCLGIDLVFFVDAPHGVNEEKFGTKLSTLKDRYMDQLLHVHDKQHLQWPSLVPLQGLMTLESAGVKIVYCRGEADPELANFAQNNKEVYGILSRDSDFAIMEESALFLFDFTDIHKAEVLPDINCEIVTRTSLARALRIKEEQLPDLAILCGNDLTRPLNCRLMNDLVTELRLEGTDIKSVAEWLRGKEVPLIKYKPFRVFCKNHPDYRNAVKLTYKYYSKDHSHHSMETSDYESPCDAMLDGVKRSGVWWRDVIPESLTLGSPCMQELLLPFRKVIYFLLGVKSITEFGRTQVQSFDETSVVLPEHAESTKPHCLHSLMFKDLDANGKLLSCLYLIVNALSLGNHVENIGKVPALVASECASLDLPDCLSTKAIFVCSCLQLIAYLNQHSTPKLNLSHAELDALLITCLACCSDVELPCCTTSVTPSKRSITVNAWFLCVLSHAYLLAALLVPDESLPQPKDLFSPMIFLSYYDSLTEESKSVQTFKSVPLVDSLSSEMFHKRVGSKSPEFRAELKILNFFIDTLKVVDSHQDLITRSKPDVPRKVSVYSSKANVQKPQVARGPHPVRPSRSVIRRNALPVARSNPDVHRKFSVYSSKANIRTPQVGRVPHPVRPSRSVIRRNALRSKPDHDLQRTFSVYSSKANVRKPQVARVPHPVRPSRSVIRRNALPVKRYRDDIVCCVAENKVVCIEGETGSGKSSMIPQFILDDCIESCKIPVSQPNPITAIKLAERVSHNLREDVGKTVGYGIDSEHYEIVSRTRIIYCTREYMLQVSSNSYLCSN